MTKIVRIIADCTVPAGKYAIGGVRIVDGGIAHPEGDAQLGRELRTVEVRCYGVEEADRMRAIVDADPDLELGAVTVCQHDFGPWQIGLDSVVFRDCRRCLHVELES